MKNKKIIEASKRIAENKLKSLDESSLRTISGGKQAIDSLEKSCGTNDCWFFGAEGCDKNTCFNY